MTNKLYNLYIFVYTGDKSSVLLLNLGDLSPGRNFGHVRLMSDSFGSQVPKLVVRWYLWAKHVLLLET